MIYDNIDPLTPISDPTVVSNGLSSMKPDTKHVICTLKHDDLRDTHLPQPEQTLNMHSIQ